MSETLKRIIVDTRKLFDSLQIEQIKFEIFDKFK